MSQWTPPRTSEEAPPEPLIGAEVDLRDFPFMPMFVWRVRDSEFIREATREEIGCAFLLWCAAWREKPAGSLPNDDRMLSTCCKFAAGKRPMSRWLAVKRMALWNFVLCSDGRFYHPLICGEAKKSWEAKKKQRVRTSAATKARMAKKQRHVNVTSTSRVTPRSTLRSPRDRDRDRDIGDSSLRSESKNKNTSCFLKNTRNSKITEGQEPTPSQIQAAAEAGLSEVERRTEWEAFRAYNLAKGSVFADWDVAWGMWLANRRPGHGGKPNGPMPEHHRRVTPLPPEVQLTEAERSERAATLRALLAEIGKTVETSGKPFRGKAAKSANSAAPTQGLDELRGKYRDQPIKPSPELARKLNARTR